MLYRNAWPKGVLAIIISAAVAKRPSWPRPLPPPKGKVPGPTCLGPLQSQDGPQSEVDSLKVSKLLPGSYSVPGRRPRGAGRGRHWSVDTQRDLWKQPKLSSNQGWRHGFSPMGAGFLIYIVHCVLAEFHHFCWYESLLISNASQWVSNKRAGSINCLKCARLIWDAAAIWDWPGGRAVSIWDWPAEGFWDCDALSGGGWGG